MLVKSLVDNDISAIYSREPGSSPLAERIRELIINEPMDQVTQYFLFQAARRDHVSNTILPAIKEGKIVVCDRYIDSTKVYQPEVTSVLGEFVGGYGANWKYPDITFIMDMPVEKSMERLAERGNLNYFDQVDLDVHKFRRNSFLKIAKDNPKRCLVIDGDRDSQEIHKEILDIVLNRKFDKL